MLLRFSAAPRPVAYRFCTSSQIGRSNVVIGSKFASADEDQVTNASFQSTSIINVRSR
jgi:hypothetical protein